MSSVTVFIGLGVIVLYLVILGVGIAGYVVNSLGLYRLASRYQVEKPWWAWLPVVSDLLLGKVTEANDARSGKTRKWSTVMLVLSLISVLGGILFYVIYFIFVFVTAARAVGANGNISGAAVSFLGVILIFAILWGCAAMAYAACKYICMYKNFELIAPEKPIKYFLLAILVPLAYGILLMKCCKKGYVEPMENTTMENQSMDYQTIPNESSETYTQEFSVMKEQSSEDESFKEQSVNPE